MKHLIIFLGIGLLISSCAAPPKAVKTGSEIGETPEWVQTMGRYDKGEGAIGSSPKSGMGSQVQREDAMLAARNSLAQNVDIKVQSAISQTRQRLIEQGIAGASELGTLQTQNAARQMVNQRLKNSRPIKQWKDPESEELYVWVIIEQVDLDRMAGDIHGKSSANNSKMQAKNTVTSSRIPLMKNLRDSFHNRIFDKNTSIQILTTETRHFIPKILLN